MRDFRIEDITNMNTDQIRKFHLIFFFEGAITLCGILFFFLHQT